MPKKPDRVRILVMPLREGNNGEPVEYSGPATVLTGLPRAIRRHELRLIVPLADSTIYEMEKRGDLPRRFNLTPRCVVWDLKEIQGWLEQRRQTYLKAGRRSRPSRMSISVRTGR
jgi:predicted DNA-binding transcriptional regulator AlpA